MPLGMTVTGFGSDGPAHAVAVALRSLGCTACSVLQSVTHMRDLLAGKTKLKLVAASTSGNGEDSSGVARANTFNLNSNNPLSIAETSGGAAGGGGGEDTVTAVTSSSTSGATAGTLAFNISQIFSSRASLEALARQRLAAAATAAATTHGIGSATSRPSLMGGVGVGVDRLPTAAASTTSDGFDEAGVVRSTAFLASLLPVGGRRGHHRVGSHLRGPSGVTFMTNTAGGGGDGNSPGFSGHYGGDSDRSAGGAARSKTLTSAHSWASGASSSSTAGAGAGGDRSPHFHPPPSMPPQTAGMDSLLQRMGLAPSPAPSFSAATGGTTTAGGGGGGTPVLSRRNSKQLGH